MKLATIAAVSSDCVEQEIRERMAGGKGLREGRPTDSSEVCDSRHKLVCLV
jgi:hypothetical protein